MILRTFLYISKGLFIYKFFQGRSLVKLPLRGWVCTFSTVLYIICRSGCTSLCFHSRLNSLQIWQASSHSSDTWRGSSLSLLPTQGWAELQTCLPTAGGMVLAPHGHFGLGSAEGECDMMVPEQGSRRQVPQPLLWVGVGPLLSIINFLAGLHPPWASGQGNQVS